MRHSRIGSGGRIGRMFAGRQFDFLQSRLQTGRCDAGNVLATDRLGGQIIHAPTVHVVAIVVGVGSMSAGRCGTSRSGRRDRYWL